MKSINPTFTEKEHYQLKEIKGENRTWREAMLEEFGVENGSK